MAYPPAITLRPCTLGGSTALESGTQLVLSAEITASRSLKWGATGWQFPSLMRTVTGTEGAELSFSLPVTDLAGWRLNDDSGSIIDVSTPGSYTHTYTIKLKTLSVGRQISERTIGPFVLPTEDGSPIDLDLMLPVGTVAGGVVSVPGTWDARVAAAEAAAVSVDQKLTTTDAGVAGFIDGQSSAARKAVERQQRIMASGPSRAAGMVCFTWDDGYANWITIAQAARDRGQRHTFCVQTNRIDTVGGVTTAEILAIHQMGHEIASHSVSHLNHATATPAQRAVEYDTSKSTLDAIVGAGNVTTYVYPVGGTARNNTTDCEAWGRYARLRDTSQTGWTPMDSRVGPFLIPSISWAHTAVLDSIRRCAEQPMIYNVFAHNPDGLVAGVPDITMAQALEAMDLAQSLGVPCVTMRDAYPGGGLVTSPTVASGSLGAWRPVGDAGATSVVPMVNPPLGYADAHCVRVSTTTTQFSGIRELIPVTPGRTYVIAYSARLGADGVGDTLATGSVYARFGKSLDYAGAVAGWDADTALVDHTQYIIPSAGDKSGAWVRMGSKFTIPEGRRFMEAQIGVTGAAGVTAEFCHVWVGEERFGVFA